MYKKQTVFIISIGLVLGLAAQSSSNYPVRKGFIIGIGLGPSYLIPKYKVGNMSVSLDNEFAIMSDIIIGYAPSDQIMIYWSSKINWHGMENNRGDKATFTFWQGGVGTTYFLKPEPVSPFVSGGVGFSSFGAPFENNIDPIYGIGFFIGGGYEFVKHFTVKGDLIWGNPGEEAFGERVSRNTLGIAVSINFLLH
ncbi:MAG TPA: hypothetical protein ENJ95_06875 [Bacteroidetes bacterium]|nr:hypothetical protein [Bacteroidota bacterium]